MSAPRYRGVFPVVPTAFSESGELDLASQKRCVDFMIDAGSDGVCILANFSEQFVLSDDERETLTRTILEHVGGRVPVIVTTTLLVVAVLGLEFWIAIWDAVLLLAGMDDGNAWVAVPIQALGVALAVVCFRKGRKFTGIVGLFIPLVALVGALFPRPAATRAGA